ncbi:hypothetical protein NXG61_11470 [Pectinatus haikarae]
MKSKLIGIFAVVTVTVLFYSWLCLACIAKQNNVSQEDYARMSQEIVEQSWQKK